MNSKCMLPVKLKPLPNSWHNWRSFPGDPNGKEPAYQYNRHKRGSLIPGSGRSPGGGHGNPLQYSCLENPMDRGAWRATVHGVTKSWTRLKWLSTHTCSTVVTRITSITEVENYTAFLESENVSRAVKIFQSFGPMTLFIVSLKQ